MCYKNIFQNEAAAPSKDGSLSTDKTSPLAPPYYGDASFSFYPDPTMDLLTGFDVPMYPTSGAPLSYIENHTSPMSFTSDCTSPPHAIYHHHDPYTPRYNSGRPDITHHGVGRPVYNGITSPPEYICSGDQHLPSFLQIMQGLDYSPGSTGDPDVKRFAVTPGGIATSPLQQPQTLCKVCGDIASGNHFGVLSCEACKSFFRRSIRANARYACRSSRGCAIEKHTRNRCQYCRLQKCLQTGMRKEAVQEERAPPVNKSLQRAGTPTQLGYTPPSTTAMSPIPHLPMYRNSYETGGPVSPVVPTNLMSQSRMFGSLPNLKMGDPLDFSMHHQPVQIGPLSDMYAPSSNGSRPVTPCDQMPSSMYPDSSTMAHVNPSILVNADTQTDVPPEVVKNTASEVKLEDIFEGARQSLLRVIEWGKRIPAFASLGLDDQVKLLKSCWCEHVLLKQATRIGPKSDTLLLSSGITCHKDQIEDPEVRRIVERVSHEVSYWFDIMHVDKVELACLKGILLFNPDAHGLSPGTRKRVEIFQEQILSALETRCKSMYPVTPLRFAKLLLRLPALRAASLESTQHMEVQRTLGNTKMDNIFAELLDFD